jgi:hypothetical protein
MEDWALDLERIRLRPGQHASPRDGACVVELASLLAGEEFNDRPTCVCPVIAAFLRGWNDRASYAERQRLLPYAERVVDSRGDRETTRTRRRLCLEWANRQPSAGMLRPRRGRLAARARIAIHIGLVPALKPNEGAGDYAARVAFSRGDLEGAFLLLDALLSTGGRPEGQTPALEPRDERWPVPIGRGADDLAVPEAIIRRRSHEGEPRCRGPRTRFTDDADAGGDAEARDEAGAAR